MGCRRTKWHLLSERGARVAIFPGCFCRNPRVQRWQLFVPLRPSDQDDAALPEHLGHSENSRVLSKYARSAVEAVALPVPFALVRRLSHPLYAQDGHQSV